MSDGRSDGSISAEEYAQLAIWADPLRPPVKARRGAPAGAVATLMQAAVTKANDRTMTAHFNGDAAPIIHVVLSCAEVDLSITGVGRLVQQHTGQNVVSCMSEAMRQQQITGQYPTLEDHLARRSPAIECGLSGDCTRPGL